MLLERIKTGVEKIFERSSAGFRPKRSTTEQIFLYLRNILEHANQWRAGRYVHFVDFEKAFDSVPQRKPMEYRERFWDTRQDGEIDTECIPGL